MITRNQIATAIINWRLENAPFGKELGYPECCIEAFCLQPPLVLKVLGVNKEDKLRYKAGCINGKFTGFIPCIKHARQVLNKQTTLHQLISNRNPNFPPFPNFK